MFRKLTVIGSIIVVFLWNTGCSHSIIVQCSKLTGIIQSGNALLETKAPYDAETTDKLGKDLNEIAQKVKALELKDEKLQQLRNRFYQVFQKLSQEFMYMSSNLKTITQVEPSLEGRKKFHQAKAGITEAGEKASKFAVDEDTLVEELISYCKDK